MAITPSFKKRFWETSRVEVSGEGFEVYLDDRALKTPAKAALLMPTKKLAQAVADEWQAQGGDVNPATMPMTRRANVAIDKVAVQKTDVAEMLAAYGGSDLLCYRTEYPQELADRQAALWDPLLKWATRELSVSLNITCGVMPVAQNQEDLAAMAARVHAFDAFALTGFHDLVTNSGSLVIGFAATSGQFDITDLWQAAEVDDIWQAERWGADDDAAAALDKKHRDFGDAHNFYRFVRS